MANLYIDVDGVLLGKGDTLAKHAHDFLTFAIANFDCHWLTTHVKQGNAQGLLEYLRRFVDGDLHGLVEKIRPTTWHTMKTEAVQGDFHWLDDSPLQAEINWLTERGLANRWIHVDVNRHPDDLLRAMEILKKTVASPV